MAPPPVQPVAGDPAPPAATKVVVIGGGIVGVSAALALARRGVPVALCEKGRIGGEQSGRNWGWCRRMGRDPREVPLVTESLRLWRGLETLTGADTGFRTTGIAYLCDTEAELAQHRAWLDSVAEHQVDSRILSGREVTELMPGSAKRWAGALYTPGDGGAEPELAAPAIAEAARRAGATILTPCAVRGLDLAAGRVAGVVTERGRIACEAVVLAGGAWSRLFCGNHGIDLPQLKVLGSVSLVAGVADGPAVAAAAPTFGFRPRVDGSYIVSRANATATEIVPDSFRLLGAFAPQLRANCRHLRLRIGRRFLEEWRMPRRWPLDRPSPFEAVRELDPAPIEATLDEAVTEIGAAFPAFRPLRTLRRWAGLIDVTPDAVPVISAVARIPGFYLATGFSGHGFGIGPAAGTLIADLATGAPPLADPTPFRLERFG